MSTAHRLADGVGWADFGDSVAVVVDRALIQFAESVDGVRALFDRLGEPTPLAELQHLLPGTDVEDLMRRLVDAGVVISDAPVAGIDGLTPTLAHTIPTDRPLRLRLVGDARTARSILDDAAARGGCVVVDDDTADVDIVAASTPAGLAEWSAACWAAGRPHIPLSAFDGRVVLIGPVVLPGHTACFDCLTLRRGGSTEWPDTHWTFQRASSTRLAWAQGDLDVAMRIAVRLAVLGFVDGDDHVIGHATAWEPDAMTMYTARLWRVPRCPTCSESEAFSTIYPWSAPTPSAMV